MKKRKWKSTKKVRGCELCGRDLKTNEHFYCRKCWRKIIGNNSLEWL